VLNPRIPVPGHAHPTQSFDIKTFIEIRVGLINWLLFDVAFLAKQYDTYGYVTDSMWLVVAFQAFYVIDALYFEVAFFSTMDVAYASLRPRLTEARTVVDLCWIWEIYFGWHAFMERKRDFWSHIQLCWDQLEWQES